MIHMGSDHRCVMATFVINAQKKNGSRDAKMEIPVHRSINKDGNKEAFTFEERCQEPEEKIKQGAAAAQSNLKQNEDGRTTGTTEAEAEKEKVMTAFARTVKAEAETDTRETGPHDQEADANTAAAKEKPVTVRCNAHPQRSNNEETRENYNRNQNKTKK